MDKNNDLKAWEKPVATQEEFDKVQRDMIISRISPEVLKSFPWYSVELIIVSKQDYSGQLFFCLKDSHHIIVPAHRQYWQKGQNKAHMGISSGYGVFLECKYGKKQIDGKTVIEEKKGKFFLATIRDENAGNHKWQINLFNGFPKYNPNHQDPLAEHKNLKSTASRKVVERLVLLTPEGDRVLPSSILGNKFDDKDILSFIPKSNKNANMILEKNKVDLKINKYSMQRPLLVDGVIMSTQRDVRINILYWNDSTVANKIPPYCDRSGVVVFDKSQDTTDGTMNFDVINACTMQMPDYFIEDLVLIYGDEDEKTGQPNDWMMIAIQCDDDFRINPNAFQISYFWKGGKRLSYTEAVSISPEYKKAVSHPVLTPVTKALLNASPCVNREKKDIAEGKTE